VDRERPDRRRQWRGRLLLLLIVAVFAVAATAAFAVPMLVTP
jgi:hypothetical protein